MSTPSVDRRLDLLALLADGQAHSGSELASLFCVSRAAIWKWVRALRDSGIRIEARPGEGYRMEPIELLDESNLRSAMSAVVAPSGLRFTLLHSVDSTNLEAQRILRTEKRQAPFVIFAEEQTAGRGRRGRRWSSPFGVNIYMSLVWRFEDGIDALQGLSLVMGIAAVTALRAAGMAGAALKWPNDIIHAGRKLGGVLIELVGDIDGPVDAIIGVGMNFGMPRSSQNDIDQPWTDARDFVRSDVGRNALAGLLLGYCVKCTEQFSRTGFEGFADEWRGVDWLAGRAVKIKAADSSSHGIAAGVDRSGALRVDIEGRIVTVHGGEVSIRLDE